MLLLLICGGSLPTAPGGELIRSYREGKCTMMHVKDREGAWMVQASRFGHSGHSTVIAQRAAATASLPTSTGLLEGFLVFQPLKFILVSLQSFLKSLARCLGTVNIQ